MSEKKKILRMDQAVILGVSSLVGGFLLGMVTYHLVIGTPGPAAQPTASFSAPPVQAVAPPGAAMPNFSEQIRELKNILAADPSNRNAWVRLGNAQFDSNMPPEAVESYSKALEINPNDANVTTDRGIMYRRMGDFVAAVADFRSAADMDPTHYQSLFNLGLTLLHDLKDSKGALEAWEEMLTRNPPPEAAAEMQGRIDALRAMADAEAAGGTPAQQ